MTSVPFIYINNTWLLSTYTTKCHLKKGPSSFELELKLKLACFCKVTVLEIPVFFGQWQYGIAVDYYYFFFDIKSIWKHVNMVTIEYTLFTQFMYVVGIV